ncbi:MAG TPA: hypothetical protein VH054_13640 [Polyangiaceae bacterium]|jgi:hypothetical protein|nr:hypothetical protein [Polyangiaceae bacterium]
MPTAEAIFATYLLPLYPADARDLDALRKTDANPANNPNVLAHLEDAANVFVQMHARALGRECALDFTDASVHRLSAALTSETREALASTGAPGTAESALFNVIVHGAAYVGACVVKSHGATWLVRRPLWESRVRLVSRAGEAELAILSWWLHALAGDTASLADRYRSYVEVTSSPESLPPIGPPRALPRLKNVRYDVFYKYLAAHLPEIRDVGADFPSPERFEAYRFRWLDFLFVGDARMLVIAGPGEGGLHVLWLDRTGFVKSALYACDAFPEPIVKTDGDKLVFVVSHDGKTQIHEVLWWGP